MSKRSLRLISIFLTLGLLLTPAVALADHDLQTLHGTVFIDANEDGIFDLGELGIPGVTVNLYVAGESVPLATTATAADGSYEFASLEPGDYSVVEEELAGYLSNTPNEVDTTVDGLTAIPTVDFGEVPIEGSISGTVYDDLNRNRLFDPGEGELGIAGVLVSLLDAEGVEIDSMLTDGDGKFVFDEIFAGSYTVVEVDDPEPYYSTTPNEVVVVLPTGDLMDVIVNFGDFIPEEGETTRIDFLIKDFFNLALLDILELRDLDGWGYGNVARAYFIAQLSGESVGDIIAYRETMGWGNIMKTALGYAGLKGYNLGLIVSGREVPNAIQKIIDSCEFLETPEQVNELLSAGASFGTIKKACALSQEAGGDLDTMKEVLDLLGDKSMKEVMEMLGIQGRDNGNDGNNGNHGPPPCKGKNKNDPGC